jgi:exosortase/archaeosortase family protein
MSFWVAFVMANKQNWKKKAYWILGGCLLTWIINCLRVTILMVALNNNWPINGNIDHHTLFNIISYLFLFALIYSYIKANPTEQ